eukprot:799561-Rhodomonas_salina.1
MTALDYGASFDMPLGHRQILLARQPWEYRLQFLTCVSPSHMHMTRDVPAITKHENNSKNESQRGNHERKDATPGCLSTVMLETDCTHAFPISLDLAPRSSRLPPDSNTTHSSLHSLIVSARCHAPAQSLALQTGRAAATRSIGQWCEVWEVERRMSYPRRTSPSAILGSRMMLREERH